jgi:WD40 repeat protein
MGNQPLPFKLLLVFFVAFSLLVAPGVFAEDKPPGEQIFPKLPETENDPNLYNGHVYPFWGPVCQRYTYSVVYQDDEGRQPEYVRMYFNGDWIDLEKEDPTANDYKSGVKYIYKFVPKEIGSNFYFFEASNGLGKARDSIIDSPDNGPVLFESAFDKNEVVLIDAQTGKEVWSYPTGKEWVGGVALSYDGNYLAVKTSWHVYLFQTDSPQPLWSYTSTISGPVGGDVKGGIDISADGSTIFALLGSRALLFSRDSNQPVWQDDVGNGGYNAAVSANGEYMAVATAGDAEVEDTNLIILYKKSSSERLWQYHSSGNFHDVSLSDDGQFIAAATGCPDRKAYLFSKDSNQPLFRSEMLTHDSPIHQAKISADGKYIAYGAESGDGAVHFYSQEADKIIWKFPSPNNSSFRALGVSSDGSYIGAATLTSGEAYVFSRQSSKPISSWEFNASFGAADVADDGSFLAVGGTDNEVHILERDTQSERGTIELDEYVGELDVSKNNKYIAAGTSGAVYFFETVELDKNQEVAQCGEIIEPVPEESMMDRSGGQRGAMPERTLCGDGVCNGPETLDNCPKDCDPNYIGVREDRAYALVPGWLFWLFVGLFGVDLVFLVGYLVFIRRGLFGEEEQQLSNAGFNGTFVDWIRDLPVTQKRVIKALAIMAIVLTFSTVLAGFLCFVPPPPDKMPGFIKNSGGDGGSVEEEPAASDHSLSGPKESEAANPVCGNSICEPGSGEDISNCPQDCTAASEQ